MMKNPLKTLEPNIQGRDFVIGDIHGSFSVFNNLIENIKFDPAVDRMISVGDLVDRGPDSLSCLRLLHEPWFHAVLANHEQMMIGKFNDLPEGDWWFSNGGDWAMEAVNDYVAVHRAQTRSFPNDWSAEVIDFLPVLEELPFLITVNMPDGKKFHVIHAELPFYGEGKVTDHKLTDPEYVYRLARTQGGDGDSFLWLRAMFGNFYKSPLQDRDKVIRTAKYRNAHTYFNDDLSHIISGHTIVRRPITVVGQTNIDTGAYHSLWGPVEPYCSGNVAPEPWARLTCVELKTWKFYSATDTLFEEVEPYVITREDILAV